MFKLLGNGCLSTSVSHPRDNKRVIFLSFDPCHVLENIQSQFLERTLTDVSGTITRTFVQRLYEFQKDKAVKLARNLMQKHVYPSNLEKMNVLRAVQVFSPQVIAAVQHLQADSHSDPATKIFMEAGPTIDFMKKMKQWFDIHDNLQRESLQDAHFTAGEPSIALAGK